MRFIVLGAAGRMGSLHAKHLIELGHTVLSVDYDDGKGAYIRPDEWAGIEVDGIVIATPAELHAADINTVLAAGLVKHIFVEKPLCLIKQLPGMRKMVLDANMNDVRIHVGYNLRFHPAIQGLLSSREVGHMKSILSGSLILRQVPPRGPVKHFLEEWASHEVDLALYLFGCVGYKVAMMTWDKSVPEFQAVIRHGYTRSFIHVDGAHRPNVRTVTLVDEEGNCFHRDIENDHVDDTHYQREIEAWIDVITNHGATILADATDGIMAVDLFTKGSNL